MILFHLHDDRGHGTRLVLSVKYNGRFKRCVSACSLPGHLSAASSSTTCFQVIVRQPDRPERVEPFQLRIYATFYSHDAHRVSKYGRERGSGDRSLAALYMPSLHLSDLLRLPAAQLTDVASLLTATVEYNVPREVHSDVLSCWMFVQPLFGLCWLFVSCRF